MDGEKSFRPLAVAVFFWMQLFIYSWIATPVLIDRTALPGMILFFGFIGLQATTIRQDLVRRLVSVCLVVFCLIFSLYWIIDQAGEPFEPVRDLVRILDERREPDDIIVFYPEFAQGPVMYYSPDIPLENTVQVEVGMDVQTLELPDERADSSVL